MAIEGTGPCVNNQQFFIADNTLVFDDANLFCQNLGGDLVSFESEAEFNAAVGFASGTSVYTGLFDDGLSGNGDFSRFSFTDGSSTSFIVGNVGLFPWAANQPNNNNNVDDCVIINGNGLLADAPCDVARSTLCSIPCDGADPGLAGGCVNNQQFLLSALNGDFDQANDFCQSAAGDLASFESETEFIALAAFGQAGWTGLFDDGASGNGDFTRFSFTDGSSTTFVEGNTVGEFPWAASQPNNNNGVDDCVIVNGNGLLADAPCDGNRRAICQVPCTDAPTVNPTQNPTQNPTANPTILVPTQNPTQNPSINPTVSPTDNPTQSPTTPAPTQNPTQNPTTNPTQSPTQNPTQSPTQSPTQNPTLAPTQNPTQSPTQNPTRNPTQNPTRAPTRGPTDNPTQNPTTSPTLNPTLSPTTPIPTQNPTKGPTNIPTRNPTQNPTGTPTQNPTASPTIDDDDDDGFLGLGIGLIGEAAGGGALIFLLFCILCIVIFCCCKKGESVEEAKEDFDYSYQNDNEKVGGNSI